MHHILFWSLQHVEFLTKLCRWDVSQKFLVSVPDIFELKLDTVREISSFDIWIPNVFPWIFRWIEILLLCGLEEQHENIFFLRRFNSIKNPSKSFDIDLLIIFAGIFSIKKKTMPLSLELLSYLNGGPYFSVINCAFSKEQSNFVSYTMSMSMLFFIILDNISNMFLIELITVYPIIVLLMLDRRIFFKNINRGSSISSKISIGFSETVFST